MPTQPEILSRKIAFQDCLNQQDVLGFISHARGQGQEQGKQTHKRTESLFSGIMGGLGLETDESSQVVVYGA